MSVDLPYRIRVSGREPSFVGLFLILFCVMEILTSQGGELKPQEVVALGCLVLLLCWQFCFPGLFGNHPSCVLGSALWQSGCLMSLFPEVESFFFPYYPMGMDYHEDIFIISVGVKSSTYYRRILDLNLMSLNLLLIFP